jgi:predicted DNA-binding transcriptional regulator AlpA
LSSGRIIRGWKALQERLGGRSRVQIYRDIRDGKFPAPFELGPNSIGWYEQQVEQHLASRPKRTYGRKVEAA